MKRLLLIFLIITPFLGFGQSIVNQGSPSTITINKGGLQADSILTIPKRGTTLYYGRTGNIAIDAVTNKLKYHNGTQWVLVSDATGSTVIAEMSELEGAGLVYSLSYTPLANSLTITVNGVDVPYNLSGTVVTLNVPYSVDEGDDVRIHYLHN